MRTHEIESWVLNAYDRARKGAQVEDSVVEFKRVWPEPKPAARRIAGHANAARGAPILWVIGVDERTAEVVGANQEELATWWARIHAEFDEISPAMTEVVVVLDGKPVVAMLFETTRAPFMVRNPTGGTVQFEVPWRYATGVRTARRSELLQVLSPRALLPEVEVMDASLKIEFTKGEPLLQLDVDLYVVPKSEQRVVVPFHRCRARIESPTGDSAEFSSFAAHPPTTFSFRAILDREPAVPYSPLAASTRSELILDGPCPVNVHAADILIGVPWGPLTAVIDISCVGTAGVATVTFPLERTGMYGPGEVRWRLEPAPPERTNSPESA